MERDVSSEDGRVCNADFIADFTTRVSMAPAVRSIKRKEAINWPRMSTTFWAVLLLTALLIVYCGEFAVCAMRLLRV